MISIIIDLIKIVAIIILGVIIIGGWLLDSGNDILYIVGIFFDLLLIIPIAILIKSIKQKLEN
ncbi:hypothetical protein [Spirochaeta cellobiosiphila]|uniref:hypothetical protein n=1 Tax=Spirochaeta cellobiosiphila TaxID=504483 RepID=UPI00041C1D08|nr:hypothetical protein [Spirochaeta cellobiosiphila]